MQAEKFWQFSLKTYSSNRVAETCLELQDVHGQDVNLLLFCCWCGTEGIRVNKSLLETAISVSEGWQDGLVTPLRNGRRWLKAELTGDTLQPELRHRMQQLRLSVKQLELEAEKHQQWQLASLLAKHPGLSEPDTPPLTLVEDNLQACLKNTMKKGTAAPPALLAVLTQASVSSRTLPASDQT